MAALLTTLPCWSCARVDAAGLPPVEPGDATQLDPSAREAIEERIEAVRADPSSAGAHGELALVYAASGMWAEAAAAFEHAARLDPRAPLWRFHQAIAVQATGDLDGALALYAALADALAGSVAFQHRRGDALLERGRVSEALACFERVVQLRPDLAEGWAGRGSARLELQDAAHAVADLGRAVEIDPTYRLAHYRLGLAQRALGEDELARRELGLGQDGKPRYLSDELDVRGQELVVAFGARMERAVALLNAGHDTEAVTLLEDLERRHPDDAGLLNNLAAGYRRVGRAREARERLEHVQRLQPDDMASAINLAALRLDLGDAAGAIAMAHHAVEIAPEHRTPHLILGQALARAGDLPGARTALERSLELGASAEGHDLLGEVRAAQGDLEAATACFRRALAADPRRLSAHLSLCRVLLERERLAEAQVALDEARRQAPNHPQVAALTRQLVQRRGGGR